MAVSTPEIIKRRKITLQDCWAMAKCAANRLNDVEACNVIGINPETWRKWKVRVKNQSRFESILARIQGERINAHLENVESQSKDDWRASIAYLEKTMPERFGRDSGQPQVTVNAQSGSLVLVLDRIYGNKALTTQDKPAIDVGHETKALSDAPTAEPTQPDATKG